jgi:hypothetical protein
VTTTSGSIGTKAILNQFLLVNVFISIVVIINML